MARSVIEYAARLDDATPAQRDRFVDLLRAVGLGAVVLGHWLAAVVAVEPDGRLAGTSLLALAGWTHWATWVFQVMPVFFFVGGYANAVSWRRHDHAGGHWTAWVHRRSLRLLKPTAAFVALTVAVVVLAHVAGADPVMLARGGWAAGIALWFLAVYLAVAGLTPMTHRLHRRFGAKATLGLALAVVAGDLARVATSEPAWATANFVLGWALVHQFGYWWHDGRLPSRRPAALAVLAGGALALLALVLTGPWPVALVDVPGAALQNSSPPSLALFGLFAVQLGIILAVAEPARRWLGRPLVWAAVAGVNRIILTLFLWHMAAVVAGAVGLYATGLIPRHDPGSLAWFAWRPLWLAVLALVVAVPVAALTPLERRAAKAVEAVSPRPRRAAVLVCVGVPVACAGLARLTLGGLAAEGPWGIPVTGATGLAVGTALTALAGRFASQPDRDRRGMG